MTQGTQTTDEFVARLPDEIDAWRRERLVTPATARRILSHYGLGAPEVENARRLNRLTLVVAVLGALLIGSGVLLFVASNWQRVPSYAKLALLVVTVLASYGAAYAAKYRFAAPRIAAGLVLLGTIVYGGGVFLIGQAYHMPVDSIHLYLLWAAGAGAMGYIAVSRPSLVVALLALLIAFGMGVDRAGFESEEWPAVFLPAAVFLVAFGLLHDARPRLRPFRSPYLITGLIGSFVLLYVHTFYGYWEEFGRYRQVDFAYVAGSLLVWPWVAGAIALSAAVVFLQRTRLALLTVAVVAALLLAWGLIAFLPFGDPYNRPIAYALVANGIAAAVIVWGLVAGMWSRRESYVNLALVLFGGIVVGRYLEVAFRMLERSLVFIGVGLVLMAVAFGLERLRRRLAARARHPGGAA